MSIRLLSQRHSELPVLVLTYVIEVEMTVHVGDDVIVLGPARIGHELKEREIHA